MNVENIEKKEVRDFLSKIIADIVAGIKHGFFTCEIECETKNNKKRNVTYKAGKSYKVTIPEEDIKSL